MSLRTALQNSRVLTFAITAAVLWLLLTTLQVAASFDWLSASASDFVGQNALGGILGVLVMLVLVGALFTLYSELSESEPAPQSWPPSE
ncbi:hypothetical protein [Halosegnis sp.]|uniref:hypothetical protein n=1 Tax=Halosegnis sp. TaxID=2864959 RepID=UPI0035D42E98